MHSIRTKFTLMTLSAVLFALSIATAIGVISIRNIGMNDADQMMHLTAATGAMNLDYDFESVEHSVETVSALVHESFNEITFDQLEAQVERSRRLFSEISNNTNGVLTYYFRIDPEISENEKGFWYVYEEGKGFTEHEVTDITKYDTNDTSQLVWFTVPKATGKGIWLPPYFTENLGARVISYNVPVYWGDSFIGVIGIEIDYRNLVSEVESIKLLDSGYAFILDEESNVIYHPQMGVIDLEETKKVLSDSTNKVIGSNHIRYHLNGIEKEAVFIPLRNGMRFYVTAPVSEIDRGWQNLVKNVLIAAVLVLTVTAILVTRFAQRITKPLTDLTNAAKQIDEGNYDITLDYNKDDEIGVLTNTFKQLISHTRDHITTLNKQIYVDALTSVRNKAGYSQYIAKLQDQMDHSKESLEFAFGVFDCNDLKHINDTYGHDKGDIYLKAASRLICRIFQHSPVFRIGGDEFAVILENEDLENRNRLMEQFSRARERICEDVENEWEKVNVAMGLAVYDPLIDTSVIDVARRADQAMYEDKHIRKQQKQKK
ncbi:MAG: GGDEF domain-containing protein [Erysipelotrichaceae bacterium]|nr:GGDEF domain-containing protein [Erysipelotrichaceae bacterium]